MPSCSMSMDENGALSDSTSQNPNSNLAIFCREVRNLLRSKPNCIIPFSKFVPAYHNHYGRQCCVYQFGYAKLIELLEAIPHVVQILGDGSNRYITLTHREQIKRFASDLIKVVKSQPGKRLTLSQFAEAYEQVLGRTFRVEDYGTNNINVLLAEIWEGTINIIPIKRESIEAELEAARGNGQPADVEEFEEEEEDEQEEDSQEDSQEDSSYSSSGRQQQQRSLQLCWRRTALRPLYVDVPLPRNNPILAQLVAANKLVNEPYITQQHPDCWFEIPRRERSEKEIKRTKYFIWDCIELLSRMKQQEYAVPFSKFIPAYHYYFNRQCKVSIFGFSKLIDLFESISPNVIEIIDQGPGEEKLIKLAQKYWPKQTPGQPIRAERRTIMSSTSPIIKSAPPTTLNDQQQQLQRRRPTPPSTNSKVDRTQAVVVSQQTRCDSVEAEDIDDDDDDDEEEEEDSIGDELDEDQELDEEEESGELEEEEEEEEEKVIPGELFPSDQEQKQLEEQHQQEQPIDSGPTEEELLELEDELEAYEELQAIQRKRSGRMAAILDIFKYSIY